MGIVRVHRVAVATRVNGAIQLIPFNSIEEVFRASPAEWGKLLADVIREAVPRADVALMNSGGVRGGFDLALCDMVARAVPVPVIGSGGAGEIFLRPGSVAQLVGVVLEKFIGALVGLF